MELNCVTVFKPYLFKKGQKIRIESGKRKGDWEVVSQNDTHVTLRCPVSHREFSWHRFCYMSEEKENEIWPETD